MCAASAFERLEALMSGIPSEPWIETDHKSMIIGWSLAALPLTGYSAQAMYVSRTDYWRDYARSREKPN